MKNFILLITAIFFTLPAFAQRPRTLVKIRDMEGRPITAEINGRKYDRVAKTLTIKDLPPGRHNLRLYTVNQRGNQRPQARLIYEGRIRTKPDHIYYVTVDDYEDLDIIEDCCLANNGPWNNEDGWYKNRYYDQQNWEGNYQMNPQQSDYYNTPRNQNGTSNTNPNDDWSHFGASMSTAQFNNLIAQMRSAGFENSRMSIAQTAIRDNGITCAQFVTIANELSFENSRLELAKDSYSKLADPQNAFTINQAFKFSSSKDDFNQFIQSNRR